MKVTEIFDLQQLLIVTKTSTLLAVLTKCTEFCIVKILGLMLEFSKVEICRKYIVAFSP